MISPPTTARLRLRRLTFDDAAFIVELLNDPDWIRYIGDRNVRTDEDARGYLARGPLTSYVRYGFGLYAVEVRGDPAPAGICGLIRRDGLDDIDLGFAFLPRHRNKGYASEASAAVLDEARTVLGLRRVVAIADPRNIASISVLRRAGMRFERHVTLGDDPTELALFAIEFDAVPPIVATSR